MTVGAFNNEKSSAVTDIPYNVGATCHVTLSAKDQYGNPISNYQFKYSVHVDNADSTNEEIYLIDGRSYSHAAVFNGDEANNVLVNGTTDLNGQINVTVEFPYPIDHLDGGGPSWKDTLGNALSHQ